MVTVPRSAAPRELSYDVYYDALMCKDVVENIEVLISLLVLFIVYLGALCGIRRINKYRHHLASESLQQCILLIPIFKTIYYAFVLLNAMCCFGHSVTAVTSTQRYILMLLVASETLNRTAISCFMYLIAHGWGTLAFDLDPLQAFDCAKFLGLAYICHSFYFMTFGAFIVHVYVRYILMIFYMGVIYKLVGVTLKSEATVTMEEVQMRDENFPDFQMLDRFAEPLRLKKAMLWRNLCIGLLYAGSILVGLVYTAVSESAEENYKDFYAGMSLKQPVLTVIIKETVEFGILFALYFNIRPRNWPELFMLEHNGNQPW